MKTYIYSKWHDAPNGYPVEFYSELNDHRYETRKVEIFRDGRAGYATVGKSTQGTRLGIEPVPSIEEIQSQAEFTSKEISKDDFERQWIAATTKR